MPVHLQFVPQLWMESPWKMYYMLVRRICPLLPTQSLKFVLHICTTFEAARPLTEYGNGGLCKAPWAVPLGPSTAPCMVRKNCLDSPGGDIFIWRTLFDLRHFSGQDFWACPPFDSVQRHSAPIATSVTVKNLEGTYSLNDWEFMSKVGVSEFTEDQSDLVQLPVSWCVKLYLKQSCRLIKDDSHTCISTIIMISECFWVVLHKSIDIAAIAIGHRCSGDIEKRRSYDRKFPSSMFELIKRGYLTTYAEILCFSEVHFMWQKNYLIGPCSWSKHGSTSFHCS